MHRVVIDSNLYIDWLNHGQHEELIFQLGTIKYLSAVVMMELFAGADRAQDQRLLHRLVAHFRRLDRLLTPTDDLYEEAGHVLQALRQRFHYQRPHRDSLVNDVLIALSARSIGAEVVTQNKRDYVAIQQIRPFTLRVLPLSPQ